MQPDYVMAVRQLQWVMAELYLGSAMITIGVIFGTTALLLRSNRNGKS
jgi:hypothetical protein